jgi:hypothetical protein
MLISASGVLVKKINMLIFFWNLYSKPLKHVKSVDFYAKFSLFGILN